MYKESSAVKNAPFEPLMQSLQRRLLLFSFVNLLVVSLIGLLLRSFPFFSSFPLEYKNILHGHSHFAFGGWATPVLFALFLRAFPEITGKVAYRHWRNITVLVVVSAYGMLLSFPVQGYKAVSITFSTLSIAAGYYLAVVVWKALKKLPLQASHRFVKWGLVYTVLSAIGPFATGPLIAMGKQGTWMYHDAIYFYLHFQYNGLFSFFVLGLLYKLLERRGVAANGSKVFLLFNAACVPSYALSVLWNQPPVVWNVIGGFGAALQLAGLFYMWQDIRAARWKDSSENLLLRISFAAFVVKLVLQLLSALPGVAVLAYHQRNLVIAYLHLVLLGFISVFVFAQVFGVIIHNKIVIGGLVFFLFSFLATEALLASDGFAIAVPHYTGLLLFFTCFFPVGVGLMWWGVRRGVE